MKLLMIDLMRLPFWQSEGQGAGGADDGHAPDAGAGNDGAGGAADAGGADGGGDPAPWWAGLGEDAQGFVKAKGLDARKPEEALGALTDIARNAEKKLGRPADSLISRPKEGQDVSAWLAEQREALGLPTDAAGYEVKPPTNFPKEAWDSDLNTRAAALAYEHAVPKSAHEAYVGLFADYVQKLDAQSAEEFEKASSAMRAELEKEWGDGAEARIAAAAQAAQQVAEKAGLASDAIEAMSSVLAAKAGDANVIRMFDAIAQALGEDSAVQIGKGAGGLSLSAADARAELDRLQNPGGDYFEAVKRSDTMKVHELAPRIAELQKIAGGRK
ncbi:MAG: hypothetical protein ACK4LQ_02120 [Pararhodobacter sp.]